MTPDQERRLRDCAFDTDINDILGYGIVGNWTKVKALVDCLTDIRDILTEDAKADLQPADQRFSNGQ